MKKFMQAAFEEAQTAYKHNEVPVGAVIVYKNEILTSAHNRMLAENDPTLHCEMTVIKKAAELLNTHNLSGCSLYVTLEPCPMCMGAIILSKISKVIYGCADYQFGACGGYIHLGSHPYAQKIEIYGGIMEQECSDLLKDFFKRIR